MVKKHIERYLSVFSQKAFCLKVYFSEHLIIYRIQDVYEPWLAALKIYG
jgi:hypothetical protein